jgi:hyperosmotically inducible protein
MLSPAAAACGGTISQGIDDATITARVKTSLLNDPQINATRIDVTTANGVVTISGSVKSKDEEARAIQIARAVNGVKDVRSGLGIGSQN